MIKNIRKILITGSSGTIGTGLFKALNKKGYKVFGFDIAPNIWDKDIDKNTIHGDLTNPKHIKKFSGNVDLVIHLAAHPRVYASVLDPGLAVKNTAMTYKILEFVKSQKIPRFIFASSREVYGNQGKDIYKEEYTMAHGESPYAESKILAEKEIFACRKLYGLDYIIFRFSSVYGKYDKSDRLFPLMIKELKQNKPVIVFGKEKLLDFTYIDDCIQGIMLGIEKFHIVKNNTFNLSSGKSYKLIEVVELLKKYLNSKSKIIIKPNRPGEVIKYRADITKAKKLLGYEPIYTLEKGTKLAIDWYKICFPQVNI